MKWWQDVKYKFRMANVVERLIAINVAIFILFYLVIAIGFLFHVPADSLLEILSFPKDVNSFLYKPWSIITYAFLHSGIWHILSNMLILYFSGTYFLTYFSSKKLLSLYFLGAIAGALVFMLSYNVFPAFKTIGNSYLIGASAAVMAILVGIATHIPNMRIRLMFLGSLKFWWIAAFFVIIDIVQIPLNNSGGHLAHLGGALLGYLYVSQLARGLDIGKPFESVVEAFGSFFSKSKKSKLRTVHRKHKAFNSKPNNKGNDYQQKIDAILDKISKSGYDSLTKSEKDFLFKAGKNNE
ncbi:MAG TPA: rhomboid family intramembrane serine protease [Salinimicrobium sp.]|nr:rhomboid family intramembrane serine protease [Salinimicrobium sp.]